MIRLFHKSSSLVAAATLLVSSSAAAHIAVGKPALVGAREVVTFGVGHGCEGADTVRVEIAIPEELAAVRGVPSPEFGDADVILNEAELPVAVVWEKDEVRPRDDAYYSLSIRITVPDLPFTKLYFPATQTCRTPEGDEITVEWDALPGAPLLDGGVEPEPAPSLLVLPARSPGWNKYTALDDITDLSVFDDAEIVWVGDEAYSSNPLTTELIADEPGVSPLVDISAGAEIWVKY
jgi:uncharacterized protein YcnI